MIGIGLNMYRFHLGELVQVDRYLLLSRDAGSIGFQSSTYLLLPKPLLEKLKRDFQLDVRNDKKTIDTTASLFLESEGTKLAETFISQKGLSEEFHMWLKGQKNIIGKGDDKVVRVVYSFRRVPQRVDEQKVGRR